MKVKKIVKKKFVRKKKEIEESSGTVYSLPTEKSKPCVALQDYSILLYGEKKIGKTTLTSMFKKAFFMLCEPGGKALSLYSRSVRNWPEFKAYITLIIMSKDFDTVIIDTADYSYEYCFDYMCTKMVIDHPSDEAWGKGWKAIKKEYSREINRLLHSGKGVIFISHAREEEVKQRDGATYNRSASTLSGQAKELLEGLVDIWAYYTYSNNQRVLVMQGDDHIDAGHRIEGRFLHADGTPIRKIPMGNSKEEAYINFVAAFENKLPQLTVATKKKKFILKK